MSNEYESKRNQMVDNQLVQRDIRDPKVINAFKKVPRHLFLDEALWPRAYEDHPVPIGEKQTISQPYIVALMTEALQLTGTEKVLEVGTGWVNSSTVAVTATLKRTLSAFSAGVG